jgi:hypothetical protein
LPRKNRAILWGGVASISAQPWYEIESPWNNNLKLYQQKWADDLRGMASLFSDTQGKPMPELDILMLDIERELPTDAAIRFLKSDTTLPAQYRKLNEVDFTERYKIDLSKLYAEPISYLKANGFSATTQLASYSDAPIKNTEFPLNFSLNDWQTSKRVLNYYMVDTLTKDVGGKFYGQNTFLAPSGYFCYEYSSLKDYSNIAYQLFQVEANVARSEKDIMVFQWLNYTKCQANSTYGFGINVKKHLVEAQAIMPFFSGAKGIWLWDNPILPDSINYTVYETYVNALYRLSQFKDFFIGNYRLVIPKAAYHHFKDKDPIWRGVVKGNEILIAAVNEFANEGESTELMVSFGEWSQKITLKGKQTYLCKFPLPDQQNNYVVYPNPSQGNITFEYFGGNFLTGELKIYDAVGREVLSDNFSGNLTKKQYELTLPAGNYFLKYTEDNKKIIKKISFYP